MGINLKTIAGTALLLSACGSANTGITEKDIIGSWYEIMPENKHIAQGVKIEEGGKAESIGMATLKYDSWSLYEDNQMILNGRSIGNGQTIDFSDTLDIITLDNDTMTLGKGEMYRIRYARKADRPAPIGGSDAATGYTYSEVLGKKIRIFEEGIKLLSATAADTTTASYVVFAPDSSKAEVFMPGGTVVLDMRKRADGTQVWNVEDDDTYTIEPAEKDWLLTQRGVVLYSSSGTGNVINAAFDGENGDTLTVKFMNNAGIAQMEYNGTNHILRQYRTASGYGYNNTLIDIRGKGRDMVLTDLSTNKEYRFTEK